MPTTEMYNVYDILEKEVCKLPLRHVCSRRAKTMGKRKTEETVF